MARKIIGHVANTFGLRGVLKVAIITDCPEVRFAVGNPIEIDGKTYEVDSLRLKNAHLAQVGVKELKDINEATPLIGKDIYAEVEPLPGTVFIDDLMGLSIVTKDKKELGKVKDVINMTGKDYLLLDNGKYLPFAVGLFVEKPDYAAKTITVTALGEESLTA